MACEVTQWLDLFQDKAKNLGWSVEQYGVIGDFPLLALIKKGKDNEKPPIYVSSGIHGDEPAGPMALLELVIEQAFSDDENWIVIPMINPTGMKLQTRENAEGVDLNRDYKKFRTYEAKVHADWLSQQPLPKLALSLHEDWETSGYYFYEINQDCGEVEKSRELMSHLDLVMSREPMTVIDEHEVRELGWIYHAAEADEPGSWPEAIYLANQGVPASFTMESPSSLELRERINLQKMFVKQAVAIFS